ncbi:MAG: three-Cys-motif partner protein TcmP [Phycisphaerae bacterium]|nr:three-Cys-motif partner protein TcmP [Phycisphaerae bacterium]
MESPDSFFQQKRPWSKYKDLILDYYLVPYLQKVKLLRRPIVVVDCFAGPGRFDDGLPGSPLIIAEKLRPLCEGGARVLGLYIEKKAQRYKQLVRNTEGSPIPVKTRHGEFRDHVDEVADLAKTCTVFIYADPFKPSDILFDDLRVVYDRTKSGSSIETLINFMSFGFVRAVSGLRSRIVTDGVVREDHELTARWDNVAGGTYWHNIVFGASGSEDDKADQLAASYSENLARWFKWRLWCPIREKYADKNPKYHLVFGSPSEHAVDLMNRAMVKARRKFIEDGFIKGFLFPNQPEKEVFNLEEVIKLVLATAGVTNKVSWRKLRLCTTMAKPGTYTDSEFNRAIKEAIRSGRLGSDCPGKKIEDNAAVWPLR